MRKKTLLFSVAVVFFTTAFNNITTAQDYLGTPYGGYAWTIPGRIEAENFDEGGEDIAYNDSDVVNHGGAYRDYEGVDIERTTDVTGDFNIGWTAKEEWIKYTVDVLNAGDYNIAIRYGTQTGGSITIAFVSGPDTVTVKTNAPANGAWTVWGWVYVNVHLKAGPQVMILSPGANINYFQITQNPVTGISVPETATMPSVGSILKLTASILPKNASNTLVTWSSSNAAIATVDNTGLVTAIAAGDVYIKATTTDGGLADSCLVKVMGTAEIKDLNGAFVTVFPNPITDHLKLSVAADRIIISDIEGKIVATKLNCNDIDLSNISSGMYFVKIALNGTVVTEKIIKK